MFYIFNFILHTYSLDSGAISDTAVISLAAEKRESGDGWGSEELGISPEPNPLTSFHYLPLTLHANHIPAVVYPAVV